MPSPVFELDIGIGAAGARATTTRPAAMIAPSAAYVPPSAAASDKAWQESLSRIVDLGFRQAVIAWPFGDGSSSRSAADVSVWPGRGATGNAVAALAVQAREAGLSLMLDLIVTPTPGSAYARAVQAADLTQSAGIDPRRLSPTQPETPIEDDGLRRRIVSFWRDELARWAQAGVHGIVCHHIGVLEPDEWQDLLQGARSTIPGFHVIGWSAALGRSEAIRRASAFDSLTVSSTWWDGQSSWYMKECRDLSRHAPIVGIADLPFGRRLASRVAPSDIDRCHRLALSAATLLTDGWLMPLGFEQGSHGSFPTAALDNSRDLDLTDEIREANRQLAQRNGRLDVTPVPTVDGVTLALRHGPDGSHSLVLINGSRRDVEAPAAAVAARHGFRLEEAASAVMPAGDGAILPLIPAVPIRVPAPDLTAVEAPRIAIEAVTPSVDDGRFAAKRLVGDEVVVEADIFTDGHEMIGAELRWRTADGDWITAPLAPLGNDRWRGSFPLSQVGLHEFAIEAWWDHVGTFRRDLQKKRAAGVDIALDIREGTVLLERAIDNADAKDREIIAAALKEVAAGDAAAVDVLLSETLHKALSRSDDRAFRTSTDKIYPVYADRREAEFAAWYELFPRSITDSPARHGTFRDVIARLPAICDMGFDVLYFPPIHPIGRKNRKGRNNSLTAGPADPGSPYAIGSAEGGHEALHPELGSREDFRALVAAARDHGLEVALDFAIQCSPDHPWLTQHPGWFQWRPDGSMRYAENPPKKYEDIVNVDFYGPDALPDLWVSLRDVVQSWVDEGVRIFRVDNPHTKPFPFWEWLIADIRSRDPGVIFLAEAFTRPKVMYRLGKLGFAQSYTYFTWRNHKREIQDYLDELSRPPVADFYRPHFFVNTPDINPLFLQTSGRPGFLIRATLAATLSGLWGVYSGFELCEADPVPGKEEYLDSEKYEIKPRDWEAPGNIIAEITRLNTIRRDEPALHSQRHVTFYNAFNEQVLWYGKRQPGADEMVLVAVSLDPHGPQEADVELPLWEFGLPDHASVQAEDLFDERRFTLTGKMQRLRLEPGRPFAIWRIHPAGVSTR